MNPLRRPLVELCRWAVALLFAVSGLIKVNDPKGFTYKIEEYLEVFHAMAPGLGLRGALLPLAPVAAVAIAVLEVLLAVLLLLGLWRAFTTGLLLVMIVFFTVLTGFSAITGAVTDCGCFGEVLPITPTQSFVKDLVLLLLISVLVIWREAIRPAFGAGLRLALAAVAAVGTAALALHTQRSLPVVDFSAFAIGKSIPQGLATRKASGEPVIKDYLPLRGRCGFDEFEGRVLWVVVTDADALSADDRRTLAAYAADSSLRLAVLTASGSAARARLAQALGPAGARACIVPQDLTLVKTIVRSSPGYVLLRDGVVVGKWPRHSPPTVAELSR